MITILYFARVRESLSLDREQVALPEVSMNVAGLIEHLSQRSERIWAETLGQENLLISVNQVVVKQDHALEDGDELAFFPPVSGG